MNSPIFELSENLNFIMWCNFLESRETTF